MATSRRKITKERITAQIQELLFFQEKGVNVSEEAKKVTQEKLRLVEFELTRESEELRDDKKEADIEEQLANKS